MVKTRMSLSRRLAIVAALCATMAGLSVSSAQARVWVGIGVPLYVGPGYYPPPVYYPPPPVYYTPPPAVVYTPQPNYTPPPPAYSPASQGGSQSCMAGPYVCPMDRPVPAGAACYCTGNSGQHIRGQAN